MIITEFTFENQAIEATTPILRPKNAIDALKQAATRRVDLIMMSDSNGLNGGYGFDSGFQYALAQHYQMYATGMVSANQGGFGIGYKYSRIGGGLGADSGAPIPQDQKWKTANYAANSYAYIATGGLNPYAGGISIEGDSPIGLTDELVAHFVYGLWSSGGGTFQPSVRVNDTAGFYKAPAITATGADGQISDVEIVIPAGSKPNGLAVKWYDDYLVGGVPQAQNLAGGKFIGYYSRVENKNRTSGFSVTPLYSQGGHTMFDFAYYLRDSSESALSTFFGEIRKYHTSVGQEPLIVFYCNTGVNDVGVNASASRPTIGPLALNSGTGTRVYLDNYNYIITRIQEIWTLNQWNLSELQFLLIPSHVTDDPEDGTLVEFREYSELWATRANVQIVDAGKYFTFAEMSSNLYYDLIDNGGAGPSIHLSEAGYNAVALKIIENA